MRHFFALFLGLGVLGLFILSVADSSFLFLPVGNDLLVVYLIARRQQEFLLCVAAAAVGSCVGVLLLDLVCRKGGEEGLERLMSRKRFDYLKCKMEKSAALPIAIACLSPPPFPFTAFIAAASAFQYPRHRLLLVVLASRAARFSLVGLAALRWGPGILRITRTKEFEWFMIVFIAMCVIGSVVSVMGWIRRSRA